MRNLTITKQIKVNLTPSQWGLYYTQMSCLPAVDALNMVFETHFNLGQSRNQVRAAVENTMVLYFASAAADSEPFRVLNELLDACFD